MFRYRFAERITQPAPAWCDDPVKRLTYNVSHLVIDERTTFYTVTITRTSRYGYRLTHRGGTICTKHIPNTIRRALKLMKQEE